MYQFLLKYCSKNIANLLISIWYLLLVFANIYYYIVLTEDGPFRYIGW